MKGKILILDSYYPQVFNYLPKTAATYQERQEQLNDFAFGTSDFYSSAFRELGWDCEDVVLNDLVGRALWNRDHNAQSTTPFDSVMTQIMETKPDILCYQDLALVPPTITKDLKRQGVIKAAAGFHSCPWTGNDRIRILDVVFTSFPHYVEKIDRASSRGEFLQLGFGERMAQNPKDIRALPVVFVGGIGGGLSSGHWPEGTLALEALATCIKDFAWWGYGENNVSPSSALRKAWMGPAWGKQMYGIYARAKIVVNRHGTVAEGFANNLRMFEATGCGAMLMTEEAPNLGDYFSEGSECVAYNSIDQLISQIKYLMDNEDLRAKIAAAGHARTLTSHTYPKVLAKASRILEEYL